MRPWQDFEAIHLVVNGWRLGHVRRTMEPT